MNKNSHEFFRTIVTLSTGEVVMIVECKEENKKKAEKHAMQFLDNEFKSLDFSIVTEKLDLN